MRKKKIWVLIIIFLLVSAVLYAQKAYNKWYLVGNPSFEDKVAGVRTTLFGAEQSEKKVG